MTKWSLCAGLAAIAVSACLVAGCSNSTAPAQTEEDIARGVERSKQVRAIFDKVQGDWEKLTPEDRAEFAKLSEMTEEAAKKRWDYMKNPVTGAPTLPRP